MSALAIREFDAPEKDLSGGKSAHGIFTSSIIVDPNLKLVPKEKPSTTEHPERVQKSTKIRFRLVMNDEPISHVKSNSILAKLKEPQYANLSFLYNTLRTPAKKLQEHSSWPDELEDLQTAMSEMEITDLPEREEGDTNEDLAISLKIHRRRFLIYLRWEDLTLLDIDHRIPVKIELPVTPTLPRDNTQWEVITVWGATQLEPKNKLISECIRRLIGIERIESQKSKTLSTPLWNICWNLEWFYKSLWDQDDESTNTLQSSYWLRALIKRIDTCLQYLADLESMKNTKSEDTYIDSNWEKELRTFYSEKIAELYVQITVLFMIMLSQYSLRWESDLSEWITDMSLFEWLADTLYNIKHLKRINSNEKLAYFIKTIRTGVEKCILYFESLKDIESISDTLQMPKYKYVMWQLKREMSHYQQNADGMSFQLDGNGMLDILSQLHDWLLVIMWRLNRVRGSGVGNASSNLDNESVKTDNI